MHLMLLALFSVVLSLALAAQSTRSQNSRSTRRVAQAMSDAEAALLKIVLESEEIPHLLLSYDEIDLPNRTVVVSDTTRPCALPPDDQEEQRLKNVMDRLKELTEVPEPSPQAHAEIRALQVFPRPFLRDEDLIVEPGRVIPKDIVIACRTAPVAKLPSLVFNMPVRVVFERGSVVDREFRKSEWNRRWNQRHPQNLGIVFTSRPAYSSDNTAAGVYAYHFYRGFGGGGTFYFFEHASTSWQLKWKQGLWFE